MATKAQRRMTAVQREEKIHRAAVRLFSRKGFNGTTTREIAHLAGINEALLFRHYPTKKDLYTGLLKRRLNQWRSQILPLLEKNSAKSPKEGLVHIARTIIGAHKRDSSQMRIILYAALEDHRLGREFFRQRLPLAEFLESSFQKRMDGGEIKKTNPRVLARIFLSFVFNFILMTQIMKVKRFYGQSEGKTIRDYVDVFLRGVEP